MTVDRRTSALAAPLASHPEAKPFKDWIPQVDPYSAEANRAPEAFLAQFRLYARQNSVPDTERAPGRQLIGKLTVPLALPSCGTPSHSPTTLQRPQRQYRLRPSQDVRSGVCWCPGPPGYVPRHSRTDA